MVNETKAQETILLVEDEVLVRMPIAQYLRDCGYKVVEAVNADEAMRSARLVPCDGRAPTAERKSVGGEGQMV